MKYFEACLTILRIHIFLQSLCARTAVCKEGLVVVGGRQLRARARAHLAQQLYSAR